MMLVLAYVEPARTEVLQRPGATLLQLRRQTPVHPVVGKLIEPRSPSAYPGGERGYTVRLQQCLQRRKLILRYRAFRQAHHVNAVDLVAGGDQHPVYQIQVESLGGVEVEESIRFMGIALRGTFDGAKVACAYLQRPRQQQEIDMVGARLGAAPTGRQFVPSHADARAVHGRVPRHGSDRSSWRCGGAHLWKHQHRVLRNSRESPALREQLPGAAPVAAPEGI